MKLSKCLAFLLASFLAIPGVSACYAAKKDKIIIGTWNVGSSSAYFYTYQALESGFENIDTAKMYGNEQEVGKAIKDYERKTGKKITVTTKFKVDCIAGNGLYDYVKKMLDESISNLGHVDEFLLHEIPEKVALQDVVNVFNQLSDADEYKSILFGLSNVGIWDIENIDMSVIKVIQNPYWYGADEFFDNYGMGKAVHDFCKNNGIKYETYKTLGHGFLVNAGLSPAFLINHSIEKGFYPIVKASSKEHLQSLNEDISDSTKEIDATDLFFNIFNCQ